MPRRPRNRSPSALRRKRIEVRRRWYWLIATYRRGGLDATSIPGVSDGGGGAGER